MSLSLTSTNFAYHAGKTSAIDDFSYTFKPGTFYGIFGANGSGKSTLLKILTGELTATNPALLDGKVLHKLPRIEVARKLAYASQSEELILPFTVRECIALGRYAWGDNGADLIDRLLKEWNVEHLQNNSFAELSGGERQKIKLLRILAQDTSYILLDEPASSLDWAKQLELYENLQKIAHQQNKCIIMVCHDLYIAPAFIDEMLLMHHGKLIYSGLPDSPRAAQAVSQAFERKFAITRQPHSVQISW